MAKKVFVYQSCRQRCTVLWQARADAGDRHAADRLIGLLAERGDLDQLRARAEASDWRARGDVDGLRARAGAGDRHAAWLLTQPLTRRGHLDRAEQILRDRADAGYGVANQLAELLTQQGRGEEAERLRRFGLNPDGSTASG